MHSQFQVCKLRVAATEFSNLGNVNVPVDGVERAAAHLNHEWEACHIVLRDSTLRGEGDISDVRDMAEDWQSKDAVWFVTYPQQVFAKSSH